MIPFDQYLTVALQLGECIRQGKDPEEAWLAADMLGQDYSEHPLMEFCQCLSMYDTESMYGAYRTDDTTQEEVLDELKESIFELAAKIYDMGVSA